MIRHIDSGAVEIALPYPALVDALGAAFRNGVTTPPRQHYTLPVPGGEDAGLLVMPAWQSGAYSVVKIVGVYPDNKERGLASVQGLVLVLDAVTGVPLVTMDGPAVTRRRTAAASALAARFLAREDAHRLLVAGAGTVGAELARAHAAVRPIDSVTVWNRTRARADQLADALEKEGFAARAIDNIDEAVAQADIVSCATMSPTALIMGSKLRPGTHVDAVGAFRPDMRETDDDVLRRASLYVDTRGGALSEAGDILIPLKTGIIDEEAIQGDLFDLCRGAAPGRQHRDEITFFKSVGTGVEDWAAAALALTATPV